MSQLYVVFDADLLVGATTFAGSSWTDWPNVPPITSNPEADCLGTIANSPKFANDVSLLLSDSLLEQAAIALEETVGLPSRHIREFSDALVAMSRASGGGKVSDPTDLPPVHPVVGLPLKLAERHQAILVAAGPQLVKLAPEWGPSPVKILTPDYFRRRVQATRWTARAGYRPPASP